MVLINPGLTLHHKKKLKNWMLIGVESSHLQWGKSSTVDCLIDMMDFNNFDME